MRGEDLSISFRLRRVRTETAHVSVPITPDLMCQDEKDTGVARLDVDRLVEAAIEMGRRESTVWETDGDYEIGPHPIQTPPNRAEEN